MPKKDKPTWKKVRFPLPLKPEHPHSTRRGKKGYNREKVKENVKQQIEESEG